MDTAKLTDGSPRLRRCVPDWLDPGLVTALSQWTYRDETLPAGQVVPLLSADPRRIAFIIYPLDSFIIAIRYSPFGDLATTTVDPFGDGGRITADITTRYSLVTAVWYALSTADQTVRVIEFKSPL